MAVQRKYEFFHGCLREPACAMVLLCPLPSCTTFYPATTLCHIEYATYCGLMLTGIGRIEIERDRAREMSDGSAPCSSLCPETEIGRHHMCVALSERERWFE